ncbi:MAG: 2-C-methyl-D-erythritol 2,4-cyclodiphosphate synthase [Tissierellia bacterium]|nr:2-C-methyl-D-erythritol 2,4-cyclodiphosphate synthase [Tissierellia bacterium]
MRIGVGYDVHKLVENRKLIIGGIEIPHDFGLLGHSDADVLVHAIMDSMLGALALGDIGKHFPDNDMEYKDIDSCELLRRVNSLILERGYKVSNIDSVVSLERPKIGMYIDSMREKLADILNIDITQISIKATTTEGLGFVGTKEGASSYAVTLLEKIGD